jgi:hypothetical protein
VNKGLKTLSNLVQNHPEVLTNDMHMVVTVLVTQIKNLRSQVSRTACQVAGEMAIHLKRALEHVSGQHLIIIKSIIWKIAQAVVIFFFS